MFDERVLQDNDDIRETLWFFRQLLTFVEGNSSITSIATSPVANEGEKKERIETYSLRPSEKLKGYQQKH